MAHFVFKCNNEDYLSDLSITIETSRLFWQSLLFTQFIDIGVLFMGAGVCLMCVCIYIYICSFGALWF
jgi:hypothetical protein